MAASRTSWGADGKGLAVPDARQYSAFSARNAANPVRGPGDSHHSGSIPPSLWRDILLCRLDHRDRPIYADKHPVALFDRIGISRLLDRNDLSGHRTQPAGFQAVA